MDHVLEDAQATLWEKLPQTAYQLHLFAMLRIAKSANNIQFKIVENVIVDTFYLERVDVLLKNNALLDFTLIQLKGVVFHAKLFALHAKEDPTFVLGVHNYL